MIEHWKNTVPVLYSIVYSINGWQNNKNHAFPSKCCISNEKACYCYTFYNENHTCIHKVSKGLPRQAKVSQGVPGRLRPQIFSTFGTTRVVGRQPNAPATFTPGEISGIHFHRLSQPQGIWFCQKEPRKKSQVTPQKIDPGTIRLVAQRLNHYVTPGPIHTCT
jgi:hypothetical protein